MKKDPSTYVRSNFSPCVPNHRRIFTLWIRFLVPGAANVAEMVYVSVTLTENGERTEADVSEVWLAMVATKLATSKSDSKGSSPKTALLERTGTWLFTPALP